MDSSHARTRNICAILLVLLLNWARPAFAAEPIFDVMLSKMSPERQAVMRERVKIYMVPAQRKLMDEASSVLERELPDNVAKAAIASMNDGYQSRMRETGSRTGEVPRGFTIEHRIAHGAILCFVGDENISTANEWDGNGSRRGRLMVHEITHSVYYAALSDAEHDELRRLWIEYSKKNPHATYVYAEGDEDEGFAELGEVWFGVHQHAPNVKGLDAGTHIPPLAPLKGFLEKIFGPSRNAVD